MSEISLREVNLQTVGVKRLVKSHYRIKRFKKIKSKRKRKNNSYFKRKRLIRALILRMDRSRTDQGCSKLWQNKEETAFWKARAISLEFENKMLHKHIKQMYINMISQKRENALEHHENLEGYEYDEEADEPELTQETKLEYYDETLQELEGTTLNNKDKLNSKKYDKQSKKGRVKTNEDDAESQPPAEQASKCREEEMRLLYGKAWRKILGMETAVQLKFDLNVEKSNINYWPVVPMT